jgi:hypothetical protein
MDEEGFYISKVLKLLLPPLLYDALDNLFFTISVQILRIKRGTMLFTIKRRLPIYDAIEDFAYSRRKFNTTDALVRHLYNFVRSCGAKRPEDITDSDIQTYFSSIQNSIYSEFRRIQATQAVNLFLDFMMRRVKISHQTGIVGRPANTARTERWMKLRDKGWSYKMIADSEGLKSRNSIVDAIKRLRNKDRIGE